MLDHICVPVHARINDHPCVLTCALGCGVPAVQCIAGARPPPASWPERSIRSHGLVHWRRIYVDATNVTATSRLCCDIGRSGYILCPLYFPREHVFDRKLPTMCHLVH